MEELKRFFPEGLCCEETLELNMELVPTPAEDPVMNIGKLFFKSFRQHDA